MVAACSTHGRSRSASKSFTGKHEGIWPLERPSHIREDGIKMYPKEIGNGEFLYY